MKKKSKLHHEKYPQFWVVCPNRDFKDYLDALSDRALKAINSNIDKKRGDTAKKKYEAVRDLMEAGIEVIEKSKKKK